MNDDGSDDDFGGGRDEDGDDSFGESADFSDHPDRDHEDRDDEPATASAETKDEFSVLSIAELEKELSVLVKSVAAVLDVPEDVASMLLRNERWVYLLLRAIFDTHAPTVYTPVGTKRPY